MDINVSISVCNLSGIQCSKAEHIYMARVHGQNIAVTQALNDSAPRCCRSTTQHKDTQQVFFLWVLLVSTICLWCHLVYHCACVCVCVFARVRVVCVVSEETVECYCWRMCGCLCACRVRCMASSCTCVCASLLFLCVFVVTVLQSLCMCLPLPAPVPMSHCCVCVCVLWLCRAVGVVLVPCCAVPCLLFVRSDPSEPVWDRFCQRLHLHVCQTCGWSWLPPWWPEEGSSRCNSRPMGNLSQTTFLVFFCFVFCPRWFSPSDPCFPFASYVQFPKAADLHIAPKLLWSVFEFGNVQVREKQKDEKWGTQNQNSIEGSRWISRSSRTSPSVLRLLAEHATIWSIDFPLGDALWMLCIG